MKTKQIRNAKEAGYWTYPNMNIATELGLYYGFTPTECPHVEKSDHSIAKSLTTCPDPAMACIYPEEKVALLRANFIPNVPPLPIMTVYERRGEDRKRSKKHEYCFDILGSAMSISDATVIQTTYQLVVEDGYEDAYVEINSIGDRDSFGRFTREYGAYVKKHMAEFDAECRHLLKKNPYAPIECSHEKCRAIPEQGPRPINYLSEPSRNHFKELLEYLEMSEIPYSINTSLMRHYDVASHTVFAIYGRAASKKESELIGYGFRWAGIAKKLGLKKDVPSVSATVYLEKGDHKVPAKIKKPQCYFIQVGHEAKHKSLMLIETLRKAHIPVHHALTRDKFTAQLATAEHLKSPFILIMGQKESMDNTVLIRHMETHSQDTVRLDRLVEYLRKHIK